MAQKERIRETLSSLPTLEHLVERVEAGWKPVAIEWEREAAAAAGLAVHEHEVEEIPYGLRVSDDGMGLVASETERADRHCRAGHDRGGSPAFPGGRRT